MNWLRLLTSSSSSKVASLMITFVPSRTMTRVLNCSKNLKLLEKSNYIKLGEVAGLKITSIPSMQHSNSLIFISSNIKASSILSTMLLIEMIRFLRYDNPTFYRVLSQFCFTRRDDHSALGPKNLVPTPPPLIFFQYHTFHGRHGSCSLKLCRTALLV